LFTTATLAGSTISEVIVASVIDILLDLPTIIIFSLFIAALLNTRFKGHQLVKAIFFIPVVYNITVINNTPSRGCSASDLTPRLRKIQSFAAFRLLSSADRRRRNLIDFLISAVRPNLHDCQYVGNPDFDVYRRSAVNPETSLRSRQG